VWSTHPIERPNLVLQLGSADPVLAVQAAALVCQDVSRIDLNCGCPKPFSTQGGMGAALLDTPDLLIDILKALKVALPVPISCKIRLFDDMQKTLDLVRRLQEETAIVALAVHARTRQDRPSVPARWHYFTELHSILTVPLFVNGDLLDWSCIKKLQQEFPQMTDCLIARGAQANPCIFLGPDANTSLLDLSLDTEFKPSCHAKAGMSPCALDHFLDTPVAPLSPSSLSDPPFSASSAIAKQHRLLVVLTRMARGYLKLCLLTGNPFLNTKYVLMHF
jgi:tRNA-dihydrouridine synthase